MAPKKRKKVEEEESEEPESESDSEGEVDYGPDDEDDQKQPEKRRRTNDQGASAVSKGTSSRPRRKASEKGGRQEEECETVDSVIIVDPSEVGKGSTKIAGFELEYTLIKPKGKSKTFRNREDWTWLFESIPEKLKQLHADGYKIVVFTNQPKISKAAVRSADITGKILDMAIEVSVPIQAFIASDDDLYKKPFAKMWNMMVSDFNGGVAPELASCIFVGNNAGRDKDWKAGAAKDSSAADRKFAANIGITFHTPEEYFLNEAPAAFNWRSVDPKSIAITEPPFKPEEFLAEKKGKQELVLMVGMQASGKSSFTKKYMIPANYFNINQDTLKSKDKCIKVTKEKLAAGSDVVVDNTLPSKAARKVYIDIAKEKGIPVRCVHFTTPEDVCLHLNAFREAETGGDFAKVPFIAYAKFKKDFEEPDLSEGFDDIKKTHFIPNFTDPQKEKLFLSWY